RVQATDVTGAEQPEITLSDEGSVVNTLVVNVTTTDRVDAEQGDGSCDTGETVNIDGEDVPECTLRAAILEANMTAPGEDRVIEFDIPGSGMPTLDVSTRLPELVGPAVIDGTSQEGGFVEIANGA